MNLDDRIRKNLKETRIEKGLSQQTLAELSGISNTTISSYETGKKTPNIDSLARLANALKVSIDRLCYGTAESSFIDSAPNQGRKIVNSIYLLWSEGVIFAKRKGIPTSSQNFTDTLDKFSSPIQRLINSLNEFRDKINTFSNSDEYLELIMESVAEEINMEIEITKRFFKENKIKPDNIPS